MVSSFQVLLKNTDLAAEALNNREIEFKDANKSAYYILRNTNS